MLTSANVTSKMAWTYYEAENYYTKGQALSPALWFGNFARELILVGEIEQGDFEKLLNGVGPQGQKLIELSKNESKSATKVDPQFAKSITTELEQLALTCGLHQSEKIAALVSKCSTQLEKGPLTEAFIAKATKRFAFALEKDSQLPGKEIAETRATVKSILEQGAGPRERRAALDLVFSAPKSVSLQALVFGDDRLVEAHRKATLAVLTHIEENYAQCRTGGRNDRQTVQTQKLAVAQFEHDLSREMDPHLHTHNVVLNMTHDGEKVRALHNDKFYHHRKLLGTMYQNELACRVRELGYDIALGKNGTFEIAGFSREQIEGFSTRHVAMWEKGITTQTEARELFYEGRKSKSETIDRQKLKVNWAETARELEFSPIISSRTPGKVRSELSQVPLASQVEALTEKSVVIALKDLQISHLSRNLGAIKTHEALREVSSYANEKLIRGEKELEFTTEDAMDVERRAGNRVKLGVGRFAPVLESAKHQILSRDLHSENLITKEQKKAALDSLQERLEKTSLGASTSEKIQTIVTNSLSANEKLSQTQLLALRREVTSELKNAGQKGKEVNRVLSEVLEPVERKIQAMTPGQIRAIEQTLASKDQYLVWQGVAGAGKTYSMRKVVAQLEKNGFEVTGLATSATAAKQLGKDAGIIADTLDSHLLRGEGKALKNSAQKEFWIVDEAGMLSAKKFEQLTALATQRNARVLLSGDIFQLASVEAGNPFHDLQKNKRTTIIHLHESVRQRSPHLQEAVKEIYDKKATQAFKGIVREMVELDTVEERCVAAGKEFLNRSKLERESMIVIAKTNKERDLITTVIRDGLKKEGILGQEKTLRILKNVDMNAAAKTVAYSYDEGLVLKFNENLGSNIKKDKPYTVSARNEHENLLVVKSETGKEIRVPCNDLKSVSVFREARIQIAPGDKIQWTKNERGFERLNNSLFQVVDIDGSRLVLQREDGREHVTSLDKSHHADHAWAITVHKSQGQTAREVLLVADRNTNAAELLVGVTRATHEVTLFVHDKEEVQKMAGIEHLKETAMEVAQSAPQKAPKLERELEQEMEF